MSCPFTAQTYPFPRGYGSHLIHDTLGQPKSTPQTAPRSVQPFFRAHRRDRQSRPIHLRYYVCKNRPHLCTYSSLLRCGIIIIAMSLSCTASEILPVPQGLKRSVFCTFDLHIPGMSAVAAAASYRRPHQINDQQMSRCIPQPLQLKISRKTAK